MTNSEIAKAYLADLALESKNRDINFLRELQSRHLAKYSFNNLAVVLEQDMPLDSESLFQKIVRQGQGGYCFEHNKLVFDVLVELGFDPRIILARVIYKRTLDEPRTHRISLLNFDGEQYVVDAGYGYFAALYPVKLEPGLVQEQGNFTYRIMQDQTGEYCYQILKNGDFVTLYTFDLSRYTEQDCLMGHFYMQKHPEDGCLNKLLVSLKDFNNIQSLSGGEFHHIRNEETEITTIDNPETLHRILTQIFQLNMDLTKSELLFQKFIAK